MKAFTLIEVMVSLLILAFLILAIQAIFTMGNTTYQANSALLDLHQAVRQSTYGMLQELQQTTAAQVTITNSGQTIQFTIPVSINPTVPSAPISYALSNNQIIREHPAGTTRVVASNISLLSFSLTGNRLSVALTAQKTVKQRVYTFPVRTTITLRN